MKGSSSQSLPQVSIWGTVSNQTFTAFLNKYILDNSRQDLKVSYSFIDPNSFEQTYLCIIKYVALPNIISTMKNKSIETKILFSLQFQCLLFVIPVVPFLF